MSSFDKVDLEFRSAWTNAAGQVFVGVFRKTTRLLCEGFALDGGARAASAFIRYCLDFASKKGGVWAQRLA